VLTYTIHQHCHNFSAWAASRAASVIGNRFTVEHGRGLLEAIGFGSKLDSPDKLPEPEKVDRIHRTWRQGIISFGTNQELVITHGVAAKLINVYLKSRFVCGGFADSPKVQALHPPIDRVLLEELARKDFGGKRKFWAQSNKCGWSKFDSDTYENVIQEIREYLNGEPMWKIERFWKGHQ
jgi:hypothetical protein